MCVVLLAGSLVSLLVLTTRVFSDSPMLTAADVALAPVLAVA